MTIKPRTLHTGWMVLTVVWCLAVLAYQTMIYGAPRDLAAIVVFGLIPAVIVWIVGWIILKVTGRLSS